MQENKTKTIKSTPILIKKKRNLGRSIMKNFPLKRLLSKPHYPI